MSEPLMGFDSNRKNRVGHAVERQRRIWSAIAATARISRPRWERALAATTDALATVAATSDDAWSRQTAADALLSLREETERWAR